MNSADEYNPDVFGLKILQRMFELISAFAPRNFAVLKEKISLNITPKELRAKSTL